MARRVLHRERTLRCVDPTTEEVRRDLDIEEVTADHTHPPITRRGELRQDPPEPWRSGNAFDNHNGEPVR